MRGLERRELPEPDPSRRTLTGPDLPAGYFALRSGRFSWPKHEALRVEEHEGDAVEDIEFEPGTMTEEDMSEPV